MSEFSDHLDNIVNKSWNFAGRCTTAELEQQNALIGLASEAGEALDIGKKMWFHTILPFERYRERMLGELGDILFYWLKTCDLFGFTHEEVIAYNRKKLESRHPELGKVTERFGPNAIKG